TPPSGGPGRRACRQRARPGVAQRVSKRFRACFLPVRSGSYPAACRQTAVAGRVLGGRSGRSSVPSSRGRPEARSMADVFLSYAREDRDVALALAQALEACGWSVWWDREIHAGEAFDQVIEQELAGA